jgi:peptidoglycan/LPS O-acetylase OafA/YrhL
MAAGGLALFCVAIFLLSNTKATGRLRAIDRWFGDLSYPIYLNHYIVLTTLFSLGVTSWTALLIFIAGSLALAWIAAVAVEIPLRHVRDAIRGHSL